MVCNEVEALFELHFILSLFCADGVFFLILLNDFELCLLAMSALTIVINTLPTSQGPFLFSRDPLYRMFGNYSTVGCQSASSLRRLKMKGWVLASSSVSKI